MRVTASCEVASNDDDGMALGKGEGDVGWACWWCEGKLLIVINERCTCHIVTTPTLTNP